MIDVNPLEEIVLRCPYCGERISTLADCSLAEQSYVEDCQVCCQPMIIDVSIGGDDTVSLSVRREND